MYMTDEELIDQIKALSALAPRPDKFIRSSSTSKGSGRRMQTSQTQELNRDAFAQAQTDFANSPAGKQLAALQDELGKRNEYSNSVLGHAARAGYLGEIPGAYAGVYTTPDKGVLPAGTTRTGRAMSLIPYALRAVPAGITSYLALKDAFDPRSEPWDRDISRGAGTALAGYASYPAIVGTYNAFRTVGAPKPEKDVPPEEGLPPRGPVIAGQPKEALKDMAKHLGVPIDPKARKRKWRKRLGAFNNADEATARTLAARFNEIGPDAAHSLPEAAVRKNVGNIIGRLAYEQDEHARASQGLALFSAQQAPAMKPRPVHPY